MRFRPALWGVLAGLAAGVTLPDEAGAVCSVLSHHPCTPGFGSVLSRHPYTPGFCGVYSGPNCIPEPLPPLNQVPVLKVEGHVGPTEPLDRDHPADRIDELGPLLATQDVKAAYRQAALDMLKRCAPLPITDGLGAAIAGRPFVVAIIDTRTAKKAEGRP